MNRSVAPNSKILQIQNMLGSIKNMHGSDQNKSQFALAKGSDQSHTDMTLLRQMKGSLGSLVPQGPAAPKVSDKVQMKVNRSDIIDKKIEKLLLAYKKQDEIALKKASNFDTEKALGKRNLLEKFGFSDDEDLGLAADK